MILTNSSIMKQTIMIQTNANRRTDRLSRLPIWILRKITDYLDRVDRLTLVQVGGNCKQLMNYEDFRNSLIPKLNELPISIIKRIANQLSKNRSDLFNLLNLNKNCSQLTNFPDFLAILEPDLRSRLVEKKVTEQDFQQLLSQRRSEELDLKNNLISNLNVRYQSDDYVVDWFHHQMNSWL